VIAAALWGDCAPKTGFDKKRFAMTGIGCFGTARIYQLTGNFEK
jgi:hypothetical protein